MEKLLYPLFRSLFGCEPESAEAMTGSGSHRQYFRLRAGEHSVVGVVGTERDENRAFLTLDKHFASAGIRVPEVLAVSEDGMYYLQEDLGTQLLYDCVSHGRETGFYSPQERVLLCRTMATLPRIQYAGAAGLDWNVCYPEPSFGERMIRFDLNYFKYCFLKATGLEFNEVRLQDDFDRLTADLLEDTGDTFMYRDFQARNVMVRDGELYFIDFQGGRRGPIYYDVASFVWQARARYPEALREEMISAYLGALKAYVADILLYQTDLVPVGEDQKQHVEIARDIAGRFNQVYSPTFVLPEPFIPKTGARIMSLQDPKSKMSKSEQGGDGCIILLEKPDDIMRAFKHAVTDSETCVRFDPENKPGVSNLMTIYSAATDKSFEEIEREFEGKGYGDFKTAVGESVVELLRPIQEKTQYLLGNKDYLESIYAKGAERAAKLARKTLDKVYRKVGFVPASRG